MRRFAPLARLVPLLTFFLGAFAATPANAAVVWNKVYGGFASPVEVTNARDGSQRIFVVQQTGAIRIIKAGVVLPVPFLDLGGASGVVSASGEQGLLGIAFHPQFPTNRQFYVNYTRKSDGATVIARYLASAGNPDLADPSSATVLLTITQPEPNHNGGAIRFGPDGYLYIGMGDGGGANDQHGSIGNAQDRTTLLGKILRIDVDNGGANPYAIPPGNPFAVAGGRREIFAIGMRNPWRISFDRSTGDLWIGDVGQGAVEEVDMLPAGTGAGANFGWRIMEGTSCTGLASPPVPCNDPSLTFPVLTYTHSVGCSVTGGYIYRGTAVPSLAGKYLYGDYCSGRIWAAQKKFGAGPWTATELGVSAHRISTFGEDEAGEIYFADYASGDIFQFAESSTNAADVVAVIEYYHAAFDHYFITALPQEVAALDSGRFDGWARTGKSFPAWSVAQAATSPVCRFYLPPEVGDSHFFSASPVECSEAPIKFPNFVFETAAAMHEVLPDPALGACPVNTVPIFRVWNRRADSNHRYVADRSVRDAMVARGYVAEGYGPDAVAMCAPA